MKIIQLAIKVLLKFRLYFIINLLGLVLSLTCGMILIRYIHQELTTDYYIKDLDRTFVLVREYQNQPPHLSGYTEPSNDPGFVDVLEDSAVDIHTTVIPDDKSDIIVNDQRYTIDALITDTTFLKIIPFPLLVGTNKFQAVTDVIITKKLAQRLFGNNDPLGKTLIHSTGETLTVVGVLAEPATKSSITFDMLISIDLRRHWSRMEFNIIKLFPNTDIKKLNTKYGDYAPVRSYGGVHSRLQFFPLKDLYMDTNIGYIGMENSILYKGNYRNIIILSVVVILLFIIGFFNYTNIYTVLMLNRAREFGMKKVFGAGVWKVFGQIWTENFLLTLVALIVVWSLVELTNGLIEMVLAIPIRSDLTFDFLLSTIILFGFPFLITVHPAMKYNSAPPITSLRSVNINGQSVVSRIMFLSLQYIVTFFIVIVSLFFMKQLNYMLTADLGYRTKDIIKCTFLTFDKAFDTSPEESDKKRDKEKHIDQIIKQKMNESTLFDHWTRGSFPNALSPNIPIKKDNNEYKKVAYASINNTYINMFGFQLLEGRLWDDTEDESLQYRMLINETAKKLFDIKDISSEYLQPERRLWWSSMAEGMDKNPPYEIVGVIKDFKANHLSKANVPLIIVYEEEGWLYNPVIASIKSGKRNEAIAFLKDLHTELMGKGDFEYSFLEDEIAAQYKEDKQVSRIYMIFALIAIFISCLGLYGLSLFDIRQRYREIALRKVNGASGKDIIRLLQRKYFYILAISFLVAIPVSYLVIIKYLEGFAYKTPVSWWLFAIAGGFVTVISYLTLNIQIKKAIKINPAEVIKGE